MKPAEYDITDPVPELLELGPLVKDQYAAMADVFLRVKEMIKTMKKGPFTIVSKKSKPSGITVDLTPVVNPFGSKGPIYRKKPAWKKAEETHLDQYYVDQWFKNSAPFPGQPYYVNWAPFASVTEPAPGQVWLDPTIGPFGNDRVSVFEIEVEPSGFRLVHYAVGNHVSVMPVTEFKKRFTFSHKD